MQIRLDGKNCLVTGANSGLGYATAQGLASQYETVPLFSTLIIRSAIELFLPPVIKTFVPFVLLVVPLFICFAVTKKGERLL